MSNPIDIANQIAAASQPLVAAVPAVAAPVAAVAPVVLAVAAPVAAVVVPAIDPATLIAEAASDGIVVTGAAPAEVPATPTAAPVVPLTRAEALAKAIAGEQAKIDAATKRRDLLTSQLASIDKIASIVSGSIIIAALGRAETARQVRAVVTGVKADGTQTKFKILVGEGFDATTEVINESQVVSVE